jgi:flagellar basal body-associated protein FliL
MKRKRSAALMLLLVALVAIIGIGFYLSVTHQEARPAGSSTPDGAPPAPGK